MAQAHVQSSDIFEPNLFEPMAKSAKQASEQLALVEKGLTAVLEASAKIASITGLESYKDIQAKAAAIDAYAQAEAKLALVQAEIAKNAKLLADIEAKQEQARRTAAGKEEARQAKAEAARARNAAREIERIAKAEAKAQEKAKRDAEREAKRKKAAAEMTDEEIRQEAIRKRQDEARMKRLKDEAILLDEQAGEIEKLAAKNRMLARERDTMQDIYSDEGKERIKAINEEINKNNEIIAENSDKLKQQKMNVGNYTDSILAALNSTNGFSSSIDGLSQITAKFSPAIGLLTVGIEKYKAWLEKAKAESESTGREVSRTSKIFRGLKIGIGALAVGAAGGIATAFASTRAGGEALQATMKKLEMSFGLLAQIALSKLGLIKEEALSVGNDLDKALAKKSELEGRLNAVSKTPLSDYETPESRQKRIKAIVDELGVYAKKVKELEESGMKPVVNTAQTLGEKLVEIFTGKTADAINAYTKSMNDLLALTGDYAIQLAKLGGQVAYLDAIEGDNTESLGKRAKAMERATEQTVKMARLAKELNETTLKTTATNLFLSDQMNSVKIFERYGVTATNASSKIRDLYENNKKFRDELLAGADPAKLNEFQNSLAALYTAEGEYNAKIRDQQNKKRQANQDSLEIDLDITQDTYAKKLALTEQEIADIKVSNEKKQKLYDFANDQLKKTQAKTVDLFADPKLAGSQNREAIMNLINIEDLEELRRAIRELEKSEIIENRLRQHVEDYRDNIEVIATLKKQIAEEDARIATLEKDTALLSQQAAELAQLRATGLLSAEEYAAAEAAIDEKYQNLAFQNKKDALESELKLVETSSEREAQIKKELAEMELELERKKTAGAKEEAGKREKTKEEEAEKDKKRKEGQKKQQDEFTQAALGALSELAKAQSEKRLKALDDEIEGTKKRQDSLREMAQKGAESATENLAFEQRKQAELDLAREKETQRQKKIELGLAVLKTYTAKVSAGDKNALGSTISDAAVLNAFVRSLPAFYAGTNEKTVGESLGAPQLPGRDGYIVRVDANETILSPDKTQEYHASLRQDSTDMRHVWHGAGEISKKLDEVKTAINSQYVYRGRDYDATERAIVDTVANRNNVIRTHKSKGGLFGKW